jgi:ABC-type Zn2+ transport system substrate-binding protein/surface adhesin
MKFKLLTTIAALIFTASAIAQQVSVNFLLSASFAQYHTYAWGGNNANQIQNSVLAQVAKQDIDTAMQSKGLTLVTEDKNPDIIITANGGMKQQTSYQAWGMRGIGGGMARSLPSRASKQP